VQRRADAYSHAYPSAARVLNFQSVWYPDEHSIDGVEEYDPALDDQHTFDASLSHVKDQPIEANPYLADVVQFVLPVAQEVQARSRSQSRSQSRTGIESNPYLSDISTLLPDVIHEAPEPDSSRPQTEGTLYLPPEANGSYSATIPTTNFASLDASVQPDVVPPSAEGAPATVVHAIDDQCSDERSDRVAIRPSPISPHSEHQSQPNMHSQPDQAQQQQQQQQPFHKPLNEHPGSASTLSVTETGANKQNRTGRASRAHSTTSRGSTPPIVPAIQTEVPDLVDVPLGSSDVPTQSEMIVGQAQVTLDQAAVHEAIHQHYSAQSAQPDPLLSKISAQDQMPDPASEATLQQLKALQERLVETELKLKDAVEQERTLSGQLAQVSGDNATLTKIISEMERESEERERQLAKLYSTKLRDQVSETNVWKENYEELQQMLNNTKAQLESVQLSFQANAVSRRALRQQQALESGLEYSVKQAELDRETSKWITEFIDKTRSDYVQLVELSEDLHVGSEDAGKVHVDAKWVLDLRHEVVSLYDFFTANVSVVAGAEAVAQEQPGDYMDRLKAAVVEFEQKLKNLLQLFESIPTQQSEADPSSDDAGSTQKGPGTAQASLLLRTQAIVAATAAQAASVLLRLQANTFQYEHQAIFARARQLEVALTESQERINALENDRRTLARKIDELIEEKLLREKTTHDVVGKLSQELELRATEAKFAVEERKELDTILDLVKRADHAVPNEAGSLDFAQINEYSSALVRLQTRNLDLLQELRDRNALIDKLRLELELRTAADGDDQPLVLPKLPRLISSSDLSSLRPPNRASGDLNDPLDEIVEDEAGALVRVGSEAGLTRGKAASEDDIVSTVTMMTDDSLQLPSVMADGSLPLLGLESAVSNLSLVSTMDAASVGVAPTTDKDAVRATSEAHTGAGARGLSALLPPAPIDTDQDVLDPESSSFGPSSPFVPEVKPMPSATAIEQSTDLATLALASVPPEQLRKRHEQLRAQEEARKLNRQDHSQEQPQSDVQAKQPRSESFEMPEDEFIQARPARSVSFTAGSTVSSDPASVSTESYHESHSAAANIHPSMTSLRDILSALPESEHLGVALDSTSTVESSELLPSSTSEAAASEKPPAPSDTLASAAATTQALDVSEQAAAAGTAATSATLASRPRPKRQLPTPFVLQLMEMLGMWQSKVVSNDSVQDSMPSRYVTKNPKVWEEVIDV